MHILNTENMSRIRHHSQVLAALSHITHDYGYLAPPATVSIISISVKHELAWNPETTLPPKHQTTATDGGERTQPARASQTLHPCNSICARLIPARISRPAAISASVSEIVAPQPNSALMLSVTGNGLDAAHCSNHLSVQRVLPYHVAIAMVAVMLFFCNYPVGGVK